MCASSAIWERVLVHARLIDPRGARPYYARDALSQGHGLKAAQPLAQLDPHPGVVGLSTHPVV